jgi:hypothetical protein
MTSVDDRLDGAPRMTNGWRGAVRTPWYSPADERPDSSVGQMTRTGVELVRAAAGSVT